MSGASLVEGDVRAHLVRLTIPMVWGILAMMSLNVVDTWFVSMLGKDELAAMSFTFPVVMVLISLGIGLMAGTSSVLARVIGNGDRERVRRLTTDSLLLSVVIAVTMSAIGLATMEPLFRLLGAEEQLLPLIRQYMTVWYIGYAAFLVPMAGVGAIRATGDARWQSGIMLAASLVNLVLDPLLIFGLLGFPAMGMAGAALATVIARAVSLAIGFHVLHRVKGMLASRWPDPREFADSCRAILHVGLPAAGTNVIIPLATGVLVAIVAGFGPEAVAGYGAAARIESLALVAFFALSAVIGPFVGQNLGAGRHDRIGEALVESVRLCLVIGAAGALLAIVFATPLMGLFSDDPDVIGYGRLYLVVTALAFGPAGMVMVINASFNGLGRPAPAVVISSVRMFAIMVPLAWLGGRLVGVGGVYAGLAIANIAAALMAWAWYRRMLARG